MNVTRLLATVAALAATAVVAAATPAAACDTSDCPSVQALTARP